MRVRNDIIKKKWLSCK